MIQVKEECDRKEMTLKASIRQLQNEITDMSFLTNQKDFKIQELDRTIMDMKAKLDKALQKSYNPQANDIVKGLKKDANTNENVIGRKQDFQLSRGIDSQNINPNKGDYQTQQQVWAEELRRADERSLKYKQDCQELESGKFQMEKKMKDLESKFGAREQEIQRLNIMYKGGQTFDQVKINYDISSRDEALSKLQGQNEHLNQVNFKLMEEMQEIKELLGICESRDPTDVDRAHLKKLVRELKQRTDSLAQENKTKDKVIEDLKSGKYSHATAGKFVSDDEISRLKRDLQDSEDRYEELAKEARRLRVESDKKSASASDKQAYAELVEQQQRDLSQKEESLRSLKNDNMNLENECFRLKEDLSNVKGKNAALQRDIDHQNQYLNKVNSDSNNTVEQFNYQKDRLKQMEIDLDKAIRDKTEAVFEGRRYHNQVETLEKQLTDLRVQNIQASGDSQSSSATVQRLNAQLNGAKGEVELLLRQKDDLEKVIKATKNDNLEAEKKSGDLYQQLLRAKENFQVLLGEQKLLSEELSKKQTEYSKSERERMNLERELLMLRPLKSQLENFSSNSQKTIEESVRVEYERSRLQSKVQELTLDLDQTKQNLQELHQQHNGLIVQNQKLVEQLKIFEQESFEIQQKVRRGFEIEQENQQHFKQLDTLRDRERELLREGDELRGALRAKEQEVDRLKGRTDNVSVFSKNLESETYELREEVQRLMDLLNQAKNEQVRSEQRKNQAEIEILDLKKYLGQHKEDKLNLEQNLAQMRRELEEEKGKSKNLQQQVERLRSLVENLDSTKEELVKRLQNTNKEKIGEEQDKAVLLNDIQNYKKELLFKDQEIQDLRKSIEQLDSTIDDLQSELDSKTEELANNRLNLDKQSREFSNVQHQISSISGKEEQYQKRLIERENEIKQLRNETQHLRQQLEEHIQVVQIKTQEVQELTEDILTLTRENKFVNQEFGKSVQENEYLKKQAEELLDRERHAQQAMRAVEMEKQDILSNYRNACIENERLSQSIQQIGMDNKDGYQRSQNLEKDVYGFQLRCRDLEQREQNYIQEIHTLERHIDHLTHQLEMAHKAMKDIEYQKDQVLSDMQNQKNLSYSLEMSRDDMNRHLAQVEADRQYTQQHMRDIQGENSVLRDQLGIEKVRYQELERVIALERKNQLERGFDSDALDRENNELKQEIETHRLRIQSLQNHIDSLQKQGASRPSTDRGGNNEGLERQLKDKEIRLEQAYSELDNLRRDNDQLSGYLKVYEAQVAGLENELRQR